MTVSNVTDHTEGYSAATIPHPCLYDQRAFTLLGLTGFDMSSGGRACDPICSESLNGAKNRIANQQFALAA